MKTLSLITVAMISLNLACGPEKLNRRSKHSVPLINANAEKKPVCDDNNEKVSDCYALFVEELENMYKVMEQDGYGKIVENIKQQATSLLKLMDSLDLDNLKMSEKEQIAAAFEPFMESLSSAFAEDPIKEQYFSKFSKLEQYLGILFTVLF